MNEIYLVPSLISSIFLFCIAIYFWLIKPRRAYILPLSFICLTVFLWNLGSVITNLTDGEVIYARLSTLGLIFLPPIIFHFTAEYTKFFKTRYYLLAYSPAFILAILLVLGYYVTGVTYRGYGYESSYDFLLFSINSWVGLFLVLFSTFILYRFYRESIGIKKRQSLFILFAIPANSFLSFISYEIFVEVLHVAQFPIGAMLDFIMTGLIVYAILHYKLPVATAAEIDFRILAETASDGIIIIDQTGHVEYSNNYFCKMVNISNKKILGKPLTRFISKSFHEKITKIVEKTIRGEKVLGLEVELRGAGDITIASEINISPIKWDNQIIGSFITIRNINERKKAEKLQHSIYKISEAARSDRQFKELLKSIHAIINELMPAKNFFIATYNEDTGEFTLPYFVDEIAKEIDAKKLKKGMTGYVFRTGKSLLVTPETCEKFIKEKKIERVGALAVCWIGVPLKITGKTIGVLAVQSYTAGTIFSEEDKNILEFVSGQVALAIERKRAEEAQKASEERYRSIVESSHAGILIIDHKFCITYANDQVSTILGYQKDEIIGKDFGAFLEEESKKLTIERYKRRQRGNSVPARYEIRAVKGNGEIRDLELSAAVIRDDAGQVKTVAQILDITDRKNAEEELRQAGERYRGIFQNAIMGIYQSTPEGRHISANPELARIYGYDSAEELVNRVSNIAKQLYVDPHRRAVFLNKLKEDDQVSKFESQVRRKDGYIIWISENARTVRDARGNILYFVGTVEDITESKNAEAAVKESEEKYRTLVKNLNVGIYRNTPGEKGKFIEANPAIIKMFGYRNRKEFLKLNVSDLYYHPDDRKRFNEKMLKDGFVENEVIQLKTKKGQLIIGAITAIAVKDERGKVRYYDGIIEDITFRKMAEEEIIKQKTYFQALFESSPEAVASLDTEHLVLEINPAFTHLFGYSLRELKGKDLDDFVLPKEEDSTGRELTEKALHGEVVKTEGVRKKKDNSLVKVSILGAPVFIENRLVGVFTIYRDISARKEAEMEREFYDSLLRHDVANRNTVIQGSLELLEEEDLSEEQRLIVKNALKSARSSTELIGMIRNLRQISGERNLTSVKLHNTISKVIEIHNQQAKSKGIHIEYNHIKGVVKADQLIENIFSNIIQNAIIHSNCSTITISGKEEEINGEKVYNIIIEDDGDGLSDSMRSSIFNMGIKNRSSPGSGLGLYLVKKITESYGGTVTITSPEKPKHGTILIVTLPKFR